MEKPLQSAPFLIEESQIECMLVWFFILTACISNPNEREKAGQLSADSPILDNRYILIRL